MHKNWRQRIAVPAVLGCLLFGTVSGLLEEKVGNHTQIALAASDYNNTETDKVEVDDGATIAKTGKYKDMDYSFMKSLVAGKQQQSKIVLTLHLLTYRIISGFPIFRKGSTTSPDSFLHCFV